MADIFDQISLDSEAAPMGGSGPGDIFDQLEPDAPEFTIVRLASQTGRAVMQGAADVARGIRAVDEHLLAPEGGRQPLEDMTPMGRRLAALRKEKEGVEYGERLDGTQKGPGWIGEIKRPDGGVSTELSIGVGIGGEETLIPLLVPTLTPEEIRHAASGEGPTEAMVQKAVEHAMGRMAAGQSPFKEAQTPDPYYRKRKAAAESLGPIEDQAPEMLPGRPEGAGGFAEDVFTGMARFAPAMAATAASGGAGLALTGAEILGAKYSELVAQNVDPDRAFESAAFAALTQTPIEYASNVLQIGGIKKLFGPGGGRLVSFVRTLARNAAAEGMEEILQQPFDEIADVYAKNPDKTVGEMAKMVMDDWKGIAKRTAYAGAVGAAGGALMAGAGGMVSGGTRAVSGRMEKRNRAKEIIDETLGPEDRGKSAREILTGEPDVPAAPEIVEGGVQGQEVRAPRIDVVEENQDPNIQDVASFAERLINGEKMDSPADIQFYENNKEAVEQLLRAANVKGVPEQDIFDSLDAEEAAAEFSDEELNQLTGGMDAEPAPTVSTGQEPAFSGQGKSDTAMSITSKKGAGKIPPVETSDEPVGGVGIEPDDERMAHDIVELHEVRDEQKVQGLAEAMENGGWVGPPLLVFDTGNAGEFALTGSHRLAAAREAGVDVPVKYVDFDLVEEWAGRTGKTVEDILKGDDLDKLAVVREIGDSDAISLMEYEINRGRGYGRNQNRTGAEGQNTEGFQPNQDATRKDGVGQGPGGRKRYSRPHTWSQEAKKRLGEKGQTENLKKGSAAAAKSPFSGPFETNRQALDWHLIAPDNTHHRVRNLKKFIRDNPNLFGGTYEQAHAGMMQIRRSMQGKTPRLVSSWKGWRIVDVKKPDLPNQSPSPSEAGEPAFSKDAAPTLERGEDPSTTEAPKARTKTGHKQPPPKPPIDAGILPDEVERRMAGARGAPQDSIIDKIKEAWSNLESSRKATKRLNPKQEEALSSLTAEKAARAARSAGVEFKGSSDGVHMFQDPESGSVSVERLEDLESEVAKKRSEFKASVVDGAANEAATSPANDRSEPTDGQKAAGNYKMGHVKLNGIDISIENPKGSVRTEKRPENAPDDWMPSWSTEMKSHYGYIRGTEENDDGKLDVFIGDQPDSDSVFVVDQVDPDTGDFDEVKVMMGFETENAARDGYLENYEPGWQGLGEITEMPVGEFKEWLKGDTTKALKYRKLGKKAATARPETKSNEPESLEAVPATEEDKTTAKKPWEMSHEELMALSDNDAREALSELKNTRGADYGYAKGLNAIDLVKSPKLMAKFDKAQAILKERLGLAFWQKTKSQVRSVLGMPEKKHREYVKEAISEGKMVPSEVLADYPDLSAAQEVQAAPKKDIDRQTPTISSGRSPDRTASGGKAAKATQSPSGESAIPKTQKLPGIRTGTRTEAFAMEAIEDGRLHHSLETGLWSIGPFEGKSAGSVVRTYLKENKGEAGMTRSEIRKQRDNELASLNAGRLKAGQKQLSEHPRDKTNPVKTPIQKAKSKATGAKQMPMFSKRPSPWHSQMKRFLSEKLPGSGRGRSLARTIESWAKKGLIKSEELEWSGLTDWLQGQGRVSKADVLAWLDANHVSVQEVEKGGTVGRLNWIKRGNIYAPSGEFDIGRIEKLRNGKFLYVTPGGTNRLFGTLREAKDDALKVAENVGINDAKFSQYQLPGGENYRELLLTLPFQEKVTERHMVGGESFKTYSDAVEYADANGFGRGDIRSETNVFKDEFGYRLSHWDEPNVLAHVRFNERTGPKGERILFIEEIQSDWHQAGRKHGYKKAFSMPNLTISETDTQWVAKDKNGLEWGTVGKGVVGGEKEAEEYLNRYIKTREEEAYEESQATPDAPFKKSWPMLAMKRMVRYAAENGFDSIAWTSGEVQAERYDLSKRVSEIRYEPTDKEGLYEVAAYDMDGHEFFAEDEIDLARIEDVVGKEMAEKIQNGEGKPDEDAPYRDWRVFSGLDLKTEHKGMKGFYDKILPSAVNKFFGKAAWGRAKVGATVIPIEDTGQYTAPVEKDGVSGEEVWNLPITPQMRQKAITEGMPLFLQRDTKRHGITKSTWLKKAINRRVKNWANAPEINIVQKQSELPEGILRFTKADDIVDGAFWNNQVYLVADNLSGTKHAITTLLHESFGHYGIKEMTASDPGTAARYVRFEESLLKSHAEQIQAVAGDYGFDMEDPWGQSMAVEEFLAREAQKEARPSFINDLMRIIREWLRKTFPNLGVSNREIRAWLAGARNAVVRGQAERVQLVEAPALSKSDQSGKSRPMTSKRGAGDIPTTKTPGSPLGGAAEKIRSVIGDSFDDHDFGLRVIPSGYEVGPGDKLKQSFEWVDGDRTTEYLPGTSTIGLPSIEDDDINSALEDLHDPPRHQYHGSQVAVVKGSLNSYGNDTGEHILSDAEVVAVFDKSDLYLESLGFEEFITQQGKDFLDLITVRGEALDSAKSDYAKYLKSLTEKSPKKSPPPKGAGVPMLSKVSAPTLQRGDLAETEGPREKSRPKSSSGGSGKKPPIDAGILPDEVERRMAGARGAPQDSIIDKIKEAWSNLKAERAHFPRLQSIEDKALRHQLADILRIHQETPETVKDKTIRAIMDFTEGLNRDEFEVVRKHIILADIVRDINRGLLQGEKVPFGFQSTDEVIDAFEKYQALASRNKKVKGALEKRNRFVNDLKSKLVDAKLLKKEVMDDEDYFHHQVLMYLGERRGLSTGSSEVRTKWRPWQAARKGSILDYNTEYVEAEFVAIHQQMAQLETYNTLKRIKKLADVYPELKSRAKAENYKRIYAKAVEEQGPLAKDPLQPFTWKIAANTQELYDMILGKKGENEVPPSDSAFGGMIDELIEAWDDHQAAHADMPKKERPPFTFNHPQWFHYLGYLTRLGKTGSKQAAGIFKAIRERDKFIQDDLGDEFVTFQDLVPEGYRQWKPDPGKAWFWTNSIADNILDRMIQGEVKPTDVEFRKILARGRDLIWIIPHGLADTLDNYKDPIETSTIGRMSGGALRAWKQYILMNPYSVIRYNINNMSGDLDVVLAYNPAIAKLAPAAAKDLWSWMKKKPMGARMQAELDLARKNGVIGSGWSVQEVEDLVKVDGMDKLTRHAILDEPVNWWNASKWPGQYWAKARDLTSFRENVLRLAAYRWFLKNSDQSVYGASKPEEVSAIKDPNERAAKLARELLGDYGNISHSGQWLRKHLMPFYSWIEINAPRYAYMLRNSKYEDGGAPGRVVAVGAKKAVWNASKFVLKASMLYGAIHLWNHLFFPDEEKELGESGRRQLHIIVGRREDGAIRTIRFQGALSDAMSFFGLEDFPDDVKDVVEGKHDISEKIVDAGTALVNRAWQSIRPEVKVAADASTGLSTYPDVFRPMPIRDRMEHILKTFKLDSVYRVALDRPAPGKNPDYSPAARKVEHFLSDLKRLLVYDTDPGVQAYYDTRRMVLDWQAQNGDERVKMASPTNASNALYWYKQAMRYGDLKAADKYLDLYYTKFGGTPRKKALSIKNAHPLSGIKRSQRYEFRKNLSPNDEEIVRRGIEWYRKVYGNG